MCEEKLVLAQEELVANRNQLSAHETQIQELKTARTELEKDHGKRDEKIKQQVEALQKLQKQQVTKYVANFWDITVVPSSKPLNHRFSCGVKVTETNATGLDSVAINKESVPDTVRLQYNLLLWAGIVITLICLPAQTWRMELFSWLCLLLQEQTEEQLKKEKSQCEELKECQSALEKDKNKLSADLKALVEKNEKVRLITSDPQITFMNHSSLKICNLKVHYMLFHCKISTIIN